MIYVIQFDEEVPYEACWTTTFPIEFDGTLEELEMEFEIASEKNKGSYKPLKFGEITFPRKFHTYHRKQWHYHSPIIYTVDAWNDAFKQRQKYDHG